MEHPKSLFTARLGVLIAGNRSNTPGEQPVRHNWVDIGEDEEGRKRVQDLNDGKQTIPTIIFEDGSILVEPSNAELVAK